LATLQKAFYFNYLAMNVGGLIGFTLGGLMQQNNSTHFVVLATIVAFTLSLMILCARFKFIATAKTATTAWTSVYQFVLYPLLLLIAGSLIFTLFKFVSLVSSLVMGLWLLVYFSIWAVLLMKQRYKRYPAYSHFLVLTLAYLLFWSVYFLIPTLMALFLSSNVDLHFYTIEFSPAWFINIMCLVVIVGVLRTVRVFSKHALNIERQFALGFALQIIALMVLCMGIFIAAGHQIALFWAVLYFIIQALAELALAPIAFSSVGQMIAPKLQPFFTGVWLSTLGVSVLIASKLSETVAPHLYGNVSDNGTYMYLFLCLVALSFIGLFLVGVKHYVLGRLLPLDPMPTRQV
jgi:dipeptide/tripeptide permease